MGRIKKQIATLQTARNEVLRLFKDGPLKTGDVLERLGYSGVNFMLTQAIGDANGEWDDSPHQLAQSDMIDDGTLVWWRDSIFQVWYGLPSQCPYETHGDESPSMKAVTEFLDSVCILAGAVPRYDKEGNNNPPANPPAKLKFASPFLTVREIDSDDNSVSVSVDFHSQSGKVGIYDYDFIVGAGNDEALHEFPYPDTPPEQIAAKVLEELEKQ